VDVAQSSTCEAHPFGGFLVNGERAFLLIFACAGVALSIASATKCDFLSFQNSAGLPWITLKDPFDGAIEARLGMFSYQIIRAADASRIMEECKPYGEQFTELDTPLLAVAQICAFCAPILAGAAILFLLMEMCVCNFFGSFLFSSTLLVVASGAQAATFCVFAEQDFWYVRISMISRHLLYRELSKLSPLIRQFCMG
jgi:hypothetical protein